MGYISIGKFADRVGVTKQTLRNWERTGRLIPAYRSDAGIRMYSEDQLAEYLKKNGDELMTLGYCDTIEQSELVQRFCVARGYSYCVYVGEEGMLALLEGICRKTCMRVVVYNRACIADFKYFEYICKCCEVDVVFVDLLH